MSSILKVDTLQKPDGSTPTAADLGIDVDTTGRILQVQQYIINTEQSMSASNNWVSTPLSVSITPQDANSLLIVRTNISVGDTGSSAYAGFRLTRDGSIISDMINSTSGSYKQGTASGGWAGNGNWRDTIPIEYVTTAGSTSATTFAIQASGYAGRTIYFNRGLDTSDGNHVSSVSTIVVYEISQ